MHGTTSPSAAFIECDMANHITVTTKYGDEMGLKCIKGLLFECDWKASACFLCEISVRSGQYGDYLIKIKRVGRPLYG